MRFQEMSRMRLDELQPPCASTVFNACRLICGRNMLILSKKRALSAVL